MMTENQNLSNQQETDSVQLPDQQLLEFCVKQALFGTKKQLVKKEHQAKLKNLFGNLN